MSEVNKNIEAQTEEVTMSREDELKKLNKNELIELLLKEEDKVKKERKLKAELKKENKELTESLEEAETIHESNSSYLSSLQKRLDSAEEAMQREANTLRTTIDSTTAVLQSIETALLLGRKSLQFDLLKGEKKNG